MIASAKTSLLIPEHRASPRLLARSSSSPPGLSSSPPPGPSSPHPHRCDRSLRSRLLLPSPELCRKSAGDPSDSHSEPPPEQASAPHQVIKDFRGGEQDEAAQVPWLCADLIVMLVVLIGDAAPICFFAQMVFYIFTIVVPLPLLNPHQVRPCF
uniref:Uncharacterized protein n=1 Tax=Oryza barthii TaxID=65489 RepID=A0A0D3HDB9_9ORYZ